MEPAQKPSSVLPLVHNTVKEIMRRGMKIALVITDLPKP
jgi:hypothetical protein